MEDGKSKEGGVSILLVVSLVFDISNDGRTVSVVFVSRGTDRSKEGIVVLLLSGVVLLRDAKPQANGSTVSLGLFVLLGMFGFDIVTPASVIVFFGNENSAASN